MKNLFLFLTIIALIGAYPAGSFAASKSVSYTIKVTLPRMIGVNYFPEEDAKEEFSNGDDIQVTTEEVWRNNKKIILKTIVPK